MKKIFTLLLAVGTITFVSAQSTAQQSRHSEDNKFENKTVHASSSHDYDHDRNGEPGYGSSFSLREKEAQMRKINREFDNKIVSVKMNRRLRNQEKSRIIRMLETQRRDEIREVQLRFERSNRRDGKRYDVNRSHRF